MTRWLPVPGYEGVYEVSEQGEIRRYGKERRTTVDKKGYVRITLSKNGKVRNFLVSALVCKAFHGPRPEGCEAAHIDGDQKNNRADNLCWKTHAENIADKFLHGTNPAGERNPNAKIDSKIVQQMRQRYKPRCPVNGVRALSREFDIAPSSVSLIINRKGWT